MGILIIRFWVLFVSLQKNGVLLVIFLLCVNYTRLFTQTLLVIFLGLVSGRLDFLEEEEEKSLVLLALSYDVNACGIGPSEVVNSNHRYYK